MKVKRVTRAAEKNRPVQLRMPPDMFKSLAQKAPGKMSVQKFVLHILRQTMADPNFVVEIPK